MRLKTEAKGHADGNLSAKGNVNVHYLFKYCVVGSIDPLIDPIDLQKEKK